MISTITPRKRASVAPLAPLIRKSRSPPPVSEVSTLEPYIAVNLTVKGTTLGTNSATFDNLPRISLQETISPGASKLVKEYRDLVDSCRPYSWVTVPSDNENETETNTEVACRKKVKSSKPNITNVEYHAHAGRVATVEDFFGPQKALPALPINEASNQDEVHDAELQGDIRLAIRYANEGTGEDSRAAPPGNRGGFRDVALEFPGPSQWLRGRPHPQSFEEARAIAAAFNRAMQEIGPRTRYPPAPTTAPTTAPTEPLSEAPKEKFKKAMRKMKDGFKLKLNLKKKAKKDKKGAKGRKTGAEDEASGYEETIESEETNNDSTSFGVGNATYSKTTHHIDVTFFESFEKKLEHMIAWADAILEHGYRRYEIFDMEFMRKAFDTEYGSDDEMADPKLPKLLTPEEDLIECCSEHNCHPSQATFHAWQIRDVGFPIAFISRAVTLLNVSSDSE